MVGNNLSTQPIHLGLGGTALVEPLFTVGLDWYGSYVERHASDGADGRLVSRHTFVKPWDVWEMHPEGCEVVVCTAGSITLHQENPDSSRQIVTLAPGEYAINLPGVWYTADVDREATALFITAGLGTLHRPR